MKGSKTREFLTRFSKAISPSFYVLSPNYEPFKCVSTKCFPDNYTVRNTDVRLKLKRTSTGHHFQINLVLGLPN